MKHCMWSRDVKTTSKIVHVWENYKSSDKKGERNNLYSAPFFWTKCHKSFKLMFTNYHISNCFIFKYISINYYYFPASILPTFINLQYHPNQTTNIYFMPERYLNISFSFWKGVIKQQNNMYVLFHVTEKLKHFHDRIQKYRILYFV